MSGHLRLFLCGTFADLEEERKSVLEAMRRLPLHCDSMEFFGARPDRPIDTCLEEVRKSDFLVVLVGHRYGNLVNPHGFSFSEAEYREATRLNKECLVYFRDENVKVLPKDVERNARKASMLEKWKTTLSKRHTIKVFRDPADLAIQVIADVGRLLQQFKKNDGGPASSTGKSLSRSPLTQAEVDVLEVLWEACQIKLIDGIGVLTLSQDLKCSKEYVHLLLEKLGPAGRNMINSGKEHLDELLVPKPSAKYQLNSYVLQWPPAAKMVCDLLNLPGIPPERRDFIKVLSETLDQPDDVVEEEILHRAEAGDYVAPVPNTWGRIAATQRAEEHQPFLSRLAERSEEWERNSPEGQHWLTLRRSNQKTERQVLNQIERDKNGDGLAGVDREILLKEIDAALKNGLKGEPNAERDRLIFWCHYKQGMTARTIANLPSVGMSVKGVESALLRITRLVRDRLV